MSVKQAITMLNGAIDPALCTRTLLASYPIALSTHVYVINALAAAVSNHVREAAAAAAAAGQPYNMPNSADPVVICNILFDFLGDGFGKEWLQLELLPAGETTDNPNIQPGEKQPVGPNIIINAMNMMLRVPVVPTFDAAGKIDRLDLHRDYLFVDRAGMERWLRVRAARNPNGELFMMKI